MKKNTVIILIACFLFSCDKENSFEKYITNEKNEYWAVWSVKYQRRIFGGRFVQYNKDKTIQNFIIDTGNKLDTPPLLVDNSKWSVTEDSLFFEGTFKRKIMTINDNVMVLSNLNILTGKSGYVILIKEKIDKNHRSTFKCEDNNRKYIAPMLLDFSKVKRE